MKKLVIKTEKMLQLLREGQSRKFFEELTADGTALCVSKTIIQHYEEAVAAVYGVEYARNLTCRLLSLPTLEFVEPYYHFNITLPASEEAPFEVPFPAASEFFDVAMCAGAEIM